jgi:hypothetical protein
MIWRYLEPFSIFVPLMTHEEILSGIEKKVELDNVGSVQFTETDYNFSEGFKYEGKINIRWNNTKKQYC